MLYVNSCCCTCLSTENLQNVHNNDAENIKWLEKLLFCLTENDSIFECAPLLLCDKCCKMLQDFYNFKKTSLKNLDLFRNCLKQLIRNPFSNLGIQVSDKQNTSAQTADTTRLSFSPDNQAQNQTNENINNENIVANVQIGAIVKLEQLAGDFSNNESVVVDPEESNTNESETPTTDPPNLPIKIHNVESLNKKYKNRVGRPKLVSKTRSGNSRNSKNSDLLPKRKFPKKTICHPCGKKFIRDDFYINHILSCSKNDMKTKNSVLNWVSTKTRQLVVTGQMKLNPTRVNLAKNKPDNNCEPQKSVAEIKSIKVEAATENIIKNKPIVRKKSGKDKFQRMECHLCKRQITTRFFRRHFVKCSETFKQDEKNGG